MYESFGAEIYVRWLPYYATIAVNTMGFVFQRRVEGSIVLTNFIEYNVKKSGMRGLKPE